MSPRRVGVYAIVASGALAGLAGSSQALGVSVGGMTDNFDSGFGFQGIAVALLARNSPIAVVPAALLFAALRQGGGVAQAEVGISSAVVDVMQGVVIISVIATAAWLVMRRGSSGAPEPVAREAVAVPAAGSR
jgi:general nucleoside transport system permease protein